MQLYEHPGLGIMDSWYIQENGVCHVYFLEYGDDRPKEHMYRMRDIGHMTSTDMRHWKYEGTVLTPREGFWLDKGLATGSTVKSGDKYYMIVTGITHTGPWGFTMAVSDDLYHWEYMNNEPEISAGQPYSFQYNGREFSAMLVADPYIYPEPDEEGYFTAFFNSRLCDMPVNFTGAIVSFKTKDFKNWTPSRVVCFMANDRLETPTVWKHGDLWYMYAGEVHRVLDENGNLIPYGPPSNNIFLEAPRTNSIFVSQNFEGPYDHLHRIKLPGYTDYWYIGKVLMDLDGEEIFVANNPQRGAIGPYRMEYDEYGITFYEKN